MWEMYLHFFCLLLPLCLWLSRFRLLPGSLRVLGVALTLTLVLEAYAAYLALQLTRNLYIYHLLIPLQYILLTLVYYFTLRQRTNRRLLLLSLPLYLVLVSWLTVRFQGTGEYNSMARSFKNVLLSCWCLLYYRETYLGLYPRDLLREPMFWVTTGLLLYSLGSFFVDGLMNRLLLRSYQQAHTAYYLSVFLGYALHLFFLVAFLLVGKPVGTGHQPDEN
ncbi:hypothetical protein FVR03_18770 [Pontibacter qinzhouensis]|uniref:Uncharacterized protein n=1 Tax=Pontibacter qinzhouensis TaxID=2603253 RepID=A0A5C8J8N1_9BACT|nr:hypothetical protein [Pontibacter qinzhouensis]TXK33748.1 hypothetical protein FVR03_18770 [Pontibacter qinzhouensis]